MSLIQQNLTGTESVRINCMCQIFCVTNKFNKKIQVPFLKFPNSLLQKWHIKKKKKILPQVRAGDGNLPENGVVCGLPDVNVSESRHLRKHVENALLLPKTVNISVIINVSESRHLRKHVENALLLAKTVNISVIIN
jgi:hypothetical protein